MSVWGYDTSVISVSISDGTTFADCSAVSDDIYSVRTRDTPQRSLTRRVWVPSDMGAAVGSLCV